MNIEYTDEYNGLLATLTDQGHIDKQADRPLPSDSLLWATARRLGPDAHLPVDVRDDMLMDLRDAYGDGFRPESFNLSRVAAEVAKLGVNAELVDTSGGCITLYCGVRVDDAHYGEPRWAVSAGTGHRSKSGDVLSSVDEFSFGPHDYSSDGITPERGTPARTIARRIVQINQLVERKRAGLANARLRVKAIAEEAEVVMWEYAAGKLPECTSGDFPPDAAIALSTMIEASVRLWLNSNFESTIHSLPQPVVTRITEVPFPFSQRHNTGGRPSLIHNGEDWPGTFQRLLFTLVDERLADPEPEPFFPAVVFYGAPGDDTCTRVEGLIVERDGMWLNFDDGFTVGTDTVLSIHVK